uniref:Uncharacterized protein n=1 Tax=Octopus bimaculoides TaxID=37653 RepID=A0A0L8GMS3_OCTBM
MHLKYTICNRKISMSLLTPDRFYKFSLTNLVQMFTLFSWICYLHTTVMLSVEFIPCLKLQEFNFQLQIS